MAIKDNKIPTPQDIKQTPQSFSQEEINSITLLRDKLSQISFQFGQLYISKFKIEEQESILKSQLKSLEEQEATIANKLTDKYGKGSIDLETGTFIPSE